MDECRRRGILRTFNARAAGSIPVLARGSSNGRAGYRTLFALRLIHILKIHTSAVGLCYIDEVDEVVGSNPTGSGSLAGL